MRIPLSNWTRLLYARTDGGVAETEASKPSREKMAELHSLQSRMSRGMDGVEPGFSVRVRMSAERVISAGSFRILRGDVLAATFRPTMMEQPVWGSPQTTFPHVRQ